MKNLNFPSYNFRLKNSENITYIFDEIRKKFVVLQPEEWVRQHCLKYLTKDKNYPISLINVEKQIKIKTLIRRCDIVIYNPNGTVFCIVECKAPSIAINQKTFDQIAKYNRTLKANYLMVTNGLSHYYCNMDQGPKGYNFIESIPSYTPYINPLWNLPLSY